MESKDRTNFEVIITGLAELYDKQLSSGQLDLYFETLKSLSLVDIGTAASRIAKTSRFFPKPVDFIEQFDPNMNTKATLAYDKVERAFREVGVYGSVKFNDPVIHAVIDNLGGWVKYCSLKEVDVKWYRKDFEKMYKIYEPIKGRLHPLDKLAGIHEENNSQKYADYIDQPALIGESDEAIVMPKRIGAGIVLQLPEKAG